MHKALGKGLEALLQAPETPKIEGESISKVSVDKVKPNRYQARTKFDGEKLKELAGSIKARGIAQPLIVTPSVVPGEFELIAGERRLRASKLAGLKEVPCIVRAASGREKSEISLIENLQREDLNPIEEADALQKLIDEFGIKQEDIAQTIGRSRSAVANRLRLLTLPEDVKDAIRERLISEGHARSLVAVEDESMQKELMGRIQKEKLTVREIEKIVSDWQGAISAKKVHIGKKKAPEIKIIEDNLQRVLGRKVEIDSKGKKGWINIAFYSLDDFQILVDQLEHVSHSFVKEKHKPVKKSKTKKKKRK